MSDNEENLAFEEVHRLSVKRGKELREKFYFSMEIPNSQIKTILQVNNQENREEEEENNDNDREIDVENHLPRRNVEVDDAFLPLYPPQRHPEINKDYLV